MASATSAAADAASSHFVTLQPYIIEVITVARSGGGGPAARAVAPPSASTTWLYHGARESGDILGMASVASSEAYRLARSHSRTTSAIALLLTTGGVVYLLYKRSASAEESAAPARGGSSGGGSDRGRRRGKSRWRQRGWLWWLFDGPDDELVEDFSGEEAALLRGRFFGPTAAAVGAENASKFVSKGKSVCLNESLNTTHQAAEPSTEGHSVLLVAPCPNCLRGVCRVRKHQQQQMLLHAATANSTANSSYNSSPMHLPVGLAAAASAAHPQMTAASSGTLPPTSTPESADDENSDDEHSAKFRDRFFTQRGGDLAVCRQQQQRHASPALHSRSSSVGTAKLYSSSRSRIPPEGRERVPPSPVTPNAPPSLLLGCGNESCQDPYCSSVLVSRRSMERDETSESLVSASTSMQSLVKGAREVRRMIREASFDSLASEFSLEMNEEIGTTTEQMMDRLHGNLSELKGHCGSITDDVARTETSLMASSRSEYNLSTSPASPAPSSSSHQQQQQQLDSSTPDLRLLEKPRRHFWRLSSTTAAGDVEGSSPALTASSATATTTEESSLEWESPMHAWHDLKKSKYKVALSSRTASEYGGDDGDRESVITTGGAESSIVTTNDGMDAWEWDNDGVPSVSGEAIELEAAAMVSMINHKNWLPESAERVELDLEAELRNTCCTSSTASSRRSSLDRSFYFRMIRQPPSGRSSVDRGSGDTPRQAIDHEQLVKSFGVSHQRTKSGGSNSLDSSGESGYQDTMESSVCSSSNMTAVTLSPVHEAKEPTNATPVRKAPRKLAFEPEKEERLHIDETGAAKLKNES